MLHCTFENYCIKFYCKEVVRHMCLNEGTKVNVNRITVNVMMMKGILLS